MKHKAPNISIVIPVLNEEFSIVELTKECYNIFKKKNISFEIIFVDDGSSDNTWEEIIKAKKTSSNIKGIRFQKNYGKSAALSVGFNEVSGKYVFTMDGDLQDDPNEIPKIFTMLEKEDYDLVSGWKKERFDDMLTKNIPSIFFNWTTRKISGIKLNDFNCGLKGYKREVVKNLELYSDMHRYIPVLAKWSGYKKIGEKVIKHRKRKYGESKFGINRFWNGMIDLILIMFMSKFGKKPIQLFGLIGLFFIFSGLGIMIYLFIGKFIFFQYQMTERPIFYIAIVSTIIGFQTFLTGFIAELILRNSEHKNVYHIKEKI